MEDIDMRQVILLLTDLIIALESEDPYAGRRRALANRAYELRNKVSGQENDSSR